MSWLIGRFTDEEPEPIEPEENEETSVSLMAADADDQRYDDWRENQMETPERRVMGRDLYLESISEKRPAMKEAA